MRRPHCAADLEYHGQAGSTPECLRAVESLLQSDRRIERVTVLTVPKPPIASHALLLIDSIGDGVLIKSGFGSGYGGSGAHWFSFALALLDLHGIALEEVEVPPQLIERVDASALTSDDLEWIAQAKPVRPRRVYEYISEQHAPGLRAVNNLWREREARIPWALIDDRLMDLALEFWGDPDGTLLKAHRRLEALVRERAGMSAEEAAKMGPARVFASAFNSDGGRLHWPGVTAGERQGRANLFVGTVGAYRNVRAHREGSGDSHDSVSELLLLNHLYRLEATAVLSEDGPTSVPSSSQGNA